jgi:hypothetical protein
MHSVSVNKVCERPIQAAMDMLKNMADHNASRAFAAVERVIRPEAKPAIEPVPASPAVPWIASVPESLN